MHSAEQKQQAKQYWLPYHHIPRIVDGNFTQTFDFFWGHKYLHLLEFIQNTVKELPYRSHMDFGCGDGRLLTYMYAAQSECRAVGIDMDSRAITYAKLLSSDSIEFICQDVMTCTETFDVITAIEVFEHIPPDMLPGIIDFLYSRLNPGGRLIFTVPSTNLPLSKKHYQHFNEQLLHKYFSHINLQKTGWLCSTGRRDRFLQKMLSNRFFLLNNKTSMLSG